MKNRFDDPKNEANKATYAPIVISSAWAKFGSRITARVKVKPIAINAYRLPTCIERINESISSVVGKFVYFLFNSVYPPDLTRDSTHQTADGRPQTAEMGQIRPVLPRSAVSGRRSRGKIIVKR